MATALALGAAASLDLGTAQLGSGSAVVHGCDPDGVTAAYVIDAADPRLIDAVEVGDVEAELDGYRVYVTVRGHTDQPLDGGVGSAVFSWDGTGEDGTVLVELPGASAADAVIVTVTVVEEGP